MLTKNEGFEKYYTPVISTSYLAVCDFCIGSIKKKKKKMYFKCIPYNALYLVEVAIEIHDKTQEI